MKRITSVVLPAIITALLTFILSGCIVFHKVSYVVTLDTPTSGTVKVTAFDMRSNAKTKQEFEQDKKNLFDYMLKSDDFVAAQKAQGKDITSRKLYIEKGVLMGEGIYKFDDISKVEGIKYEGGFHYLNLALDDSVMATNGEIVRSKEFKRIMWDSTFKELQFTMFSFSFDKDKYKPLAPYYNSKKK